MARLRTLKPGFFKNEQLAELPPLARLAFAGLWTEADREGRLEDRPKRLKTEILPYDKCDFDRILDALTERGFIQRYQVEGERYIQIVTFSKHQKPHSKEQASVIPAPLHGACAPTQAMTRTDPTPAEEVASTDPGVGEHALSSVNRLPSSVSLSSVNGVAGDTKGRPDGIAAAAPNEKMAMKLVESFYEAAGLELSELTESFYRREVAIARQLVEVGATAEEATEFVSWASRQAGLDGDLDLRLWERRRQAFRHRTSRSRVVENTGKNLFTREDANREFGEDWVNARSGHAVPELMTEGATE